MKPTEQITIAVLIALLSAGAAFLVSPYLIEPETIEVEVERIVEVEVEVVKWRDPEPVEIAPTAPVETPASTDEHAAAVMAEAQEMVAALSERFALLEAPELNHPLTGLSLFQQTQLQAVFETLKPSAEDIIEGRADQPNSRTAELVRLIVGEADVARLIPILRDEFVTKYRRDHARWALLDPLSQRLFWNLCGEA